MSFTEICNHCGGDGYVIRHRPFSRHDEEEEEKCPTCNGRGLVHEKVDEED